MEKEKNVKEKYEGDEGEGKRLRELEVREQEKGGGG